MVIKKENIFNAPDSTTIINPINCVGVMGSGLAYEFKIRYPKMNDYYVYLCNKNALNIGVIWYWFNNKDDNNYCYSDNRKIINFPTKYHFKDNTKIEYLISGLEKLLLTYKDHKIQSIASPLLGAGLGNLSKTKSLEIIEKYANKFDNIEFEVYINDENKEDKLFSEFKELLPKINDLLRERDKSLYKILDTILNKNNQIQTSYNFLDFVNKSAVIKKDAEKIINYFIQNYKIIKNFFN